MKGALHETILTMCQARTQACGSRQNVCALTPQRTHYKPSIAESGIFANAKGIDLPLHSSCGRLKYGSE